ncbi:alpha/beta hydrolase [Aquimarina sp. AU474]|uniref:alpha/beta hydrolase n=1 Tax=Aquimarina sp. AU474 TaxID=2108529 RepID=UPI000D69A82D|nr:alpha/beta hydrolase [Aquimarina sp. AU474]
MKSYYKLIKKPFFGRFMVSWRNPLSIKQLEEWTPISFKSDSGAMLKGLYSSSTIHGQSKATIVLGHPMGKEAKGYYLKNGYTDILRANGYNVFVFDINGFGESKIGNFFYYQDIIAAGIEARNVYPKLPLGYLGVSLGGQWATIAFAEQHNYNFAIIESAANTLDEFWVRFPTANKVLKIMNFLNPRLKKKIRMIDRIKDAHSLQKVLFIYSATDTFVAHKAGQRFNKAIPIASELYTIPEAKHAQITKSSYRDEYFNTILSFFNQQTEDFQKVKH